MRNSRVDSFPKLVVSRCLNRTLVHLGRCQKSSLWLSSVVVRGLSSINQRLFAHLLQNIPLYKSRVIHPLHRAYNYYNEVYKGVLV